MLNVNEFWLEQRKLSGIPIIPPNPPSQPDDTVKLLYHYNSNPPSLSTSSCTILYYTITLQAGQIRSQMSACRTSQPMVGAVAKPGVSGNDFWTLGMGTEWPLVWWAWVPGCALQPLVQNRVSLLLLWQGVLWSYCQRYRLKVGQPVGHYSPNF